MELKITCIPGDGIGPEIVAEARKVLDTVAKKYGHTIHYTDILMGGASIDAYGVPLTEEAVETAKSADAVLMGSIGGNTAISPWYKLPPNLRPEAGLLAIRKALNLFANLRPAILYDELVDACPLKEEIAAAGFDMMIMRELTGGLVLLMQGEYGRLGHLILTSLASAVCTAGLYGIVWLAIGSNLLVKTEGSAYYGMGHAAVILRAPFAALGRGIEYMLATPYIQSVGREGFLGKYADWLRSLLNEYYPGGVLVLAVLLLLCAAAAAWRIIERLRKKAYWKAGDSFMECYLVCSIVCIPLLQIVQSSLPYYRVFSFAGVVPAFAAAWLLWLVGSRWKETSTVTASGTGKLWKYLSAAATGICGILCVTLLLSDSYRAQYGGREAAIEEACAQIDWSKVEKAAVTDCDQEYLLLFLYGIGEERITDRPEEADVVLADRYLLLGQGEDRPELDADAWKLYTTGDEFAQFVETAGMQPVYENDRFVLYQK